MLKVLSLSLGLAFLWSCSGAGSSSSTPKESLYEILEKQQCSSSDFRGWAVAGEEMAAINQAIAVIASSMQDTVSVQSKLTTEVIDEKDKTYYSSQINRNYTITNASDVKVKFKKQQGKEIGVVACMTKADAAKSFLERQRLLTDSLGLASGTELNTEHPKHKNEAWRKTQMLYNEFVRIQHLLEGWGVKSPYMADELYSKAREDYKNYCQAARLHWNPERENFYSEMAFANLSKNVKIEKSPCAGSGISLAYKGAEPKCEQAGIFKCSVQPSLLIASCEGREYRLLEGGSIGGFHQKEEVALEKLQAKLRDDAFWDVWEREIQQWRPQCE